MQIITGPNSDVPIIAKDINDVTHPTLNNIKSNGLNILNISILFLAFAGIKYELYSFTYITLPH